MVPGVAEELLEWMRPLQCTLAWAKISDLLSPVAPPRADGTPSTAVPTSRVMSSRMWILLFFASLSSQAGAAHGVARWLPAEPDLHPAGFVTSLVRASSFGFSANVPALTVLAVILLISWWGWLGVELGSTESHGKNMRSSLPLTPYPIETREKGVAG